MAAKTRRSKRGPKGMRYSAAAIAERIKLRLADIGMEPKELYLTLGWDKSIWSRKIVTLATALSLRDLSEIAEKLDAPMGWPFVDWRVAEAFDAIVKGGAAAPGPREAPSATAETKGRNQGHAH
jgi:hypothetical protein